jgi:hypothetical protein
MYNIARGLHSGRFKENVLKALDDAININTLQCNYAHQMAENIDDYLESEIEELINEINRKHGNTCE